MMAGTGKPDATLTYRVHNISGLKMQLVSPQPTYVRGLPWRIIVEPPKRRTTYERNNMYLGIYLTCDGETGSSNWICKAAAKSRIMPQQRSVKAISRQFTHIYESRSSNLGTRQFVSWPYLMNPANGYIKADYIDVEIDVKAYLPYGLRSHLKEVKMINLDGAQRPTGTLSFKVQNISSLRNKVESEPVFVRNLPWRVYVEPKNIFADDKSTMSLGVYIQCVEESTSQNWSCKATVIMQLLPQKPGTGIHALEFSETFKSGKQIGYDSLMNWWALVDPSTGYVNIKDDFVELKVVVTANNPTGVRKGNQSMEARRKGTKQVATLSTEHLCCPICLDLPINEVYQCRNGHTICDDCISSLTHCPQCRVRFEDSRIRNRALEAMLDIVEIECSYRDKGCDVKTTRNPLLIHERECVYQYAI
ncbi:unnamed protein product [Orchesella dallaii]|uniref:Uncharacterized protein n=1 Tax=Orchesella dallaii TaxID=48710 RepID=A0ABP1PRD7_9HEXA